MAIQCSQLSWLLQCLWCYAGEDGDLTVLGSLRYRWSLPFLELATAWNGVDQGSICWWDFFSVLSDILARRIWMNKKPLVSPWRMSLISPQVSLPFSAASRSSCRKNKGIWLVAHKGSCTEWEHNLPARCYCTWHNDTLYLKIFTRKMVQQKAY